MDANRKGQLTMSRYIITLDCPPGPTRPGDLFPGTLEGTGLKESDFELETKLFGDWTWRLKYQEKDKLFLEKRDQIAIRIKGLYNAGWIRYGTW